MRSRTAAVSAAATALAFGLFQFVSHWLGEGEISRGTAVAVALTAFLYAWWARCLKDAGRGEAPALGGLLVLAFGWSFAGTGLASIAACLPSCEPYEWFIGIGNILFGAAAAVTSWQAIRDTPSPVGASTALISAALVVAALTLTAVTE
jgi:hypothetical protein